MLVQVCKENDVITLKFQNGEEIVGILDSKDTSKFVHLKKPLRVILTNNGASFAPWMLSTDFAETRISVRVESLACSPIKTEKKYEKAYLESCSGLTLPGQ